MTRTGPPEQKIFDAPLDNADHDLLGIKEYAERLADFVDEQQPPFTIGVYGAWGAGKTSFVQLMKAALEDKRKKTSKEWPELKFISFDAWPFKTSDDLWRALVQKIAYELYEVTEPSPPVPATPVPWVTRIGRLLRRPALRFQPEEQSPVRHAGYYDLLDRLGSIPARRPKPSGRTLDDEATILAVLQGTLAALGSLSPLLAAVRGFFGIGDSVDVAKLLRQEKNETTLDRIASVTQFRDAVEKLFTDKAKDKLVCVFIDNLDRVMPDVAIDLLEALKVFLGEVHCFFIIAADEQLIGEGLGMRYKELLQSSAGDDSARLYTRKGKEYFEKIIQLAIRVPEPGSGNVHRFLAAQFPQWLPATDLIQAAIGTNPRRLKRYCTLLTYKYMVARDPQDVEDDSPLRDKLIELRWWGTEVVDKLRVLAGEPGFKECMESLEQCLRDSLRDQPRPTADAEVVHPTALEIYRIAVMSTPLQDLFTTEPLLSGFDPGDVAVLASVVGIVPEPETATMLRSADRVLMRILGKVTLTGGVPAPERLLADDLTKLFMLAPEAPGLPPLLQTLAGDCEWQELTFAVEGALEAPTGSSAGDLPPKAQQLLQLASANESLRRKLLEPQRLSTIAREIVLRWAAFYPTIPTHDSAVPSNLLSPAARATLLLAQLPVESAQKIVTGLQLRVRAARRFIARRKFVKLDALSYSWPAIAALLQEDLRGLRAFESSVVDPDQQPQELPEGWKTYDDKKLNDFLRLRPLLKDIYADDLRKHEKASNAVVATPQDPGFEVALQKAITVGHPLSLTKPSKEAPGDLGLAAPYVDVDVRITAEPVADTYAVRIGVALPVRVKLDPVRVARFREEIEQILQGRAPSEPQTVDSPTRSPDFSRRLRDLGGELYGWFFGGATGDAGTMLPYLSKSDRFRLRLDVPADLTWVPWELLYAPAPFKIFLGLTNRYSLVRLVQAPEALPLKPFSMPLRILAVFASPEETGGMLKLDEEEKLLVRVLEPAMRRGRVTLEVLRGRDATHIAVQQKLREFRPHVFHFAGHGEVRPETEGTLILVSETGGIQRVSASDIANYLRDERVALAVLSGCDTGRTGTSDSTTSVAGALNHAGVPMVIGTTRLILDDAGLVFARDFYRALIDGYTVEASLIEARKAQSVEKWDWSAFALFTTGTYLDDLRLEAEESAARTGTSA